MSLRRGLAVFLGLTFGVSGVILACSMDNFTISTLLSARKWPLFLALCLVFCAWTCDALRFCAIARAAGERVSFRCGIVLTWLNYFGCAVTPMQAGGGPFQVYVLYKANVPIGRGVAITLTRTLLTLFLLGLVVPVAFFLEPQLFEGHAIVTGIFYYVFLVVMLAWSLFILSIIRPDLMKRWGRAITVWLCHRRIIGSSRLLFLVRRVNREIDNYHSNYCRLFTSGLSHMLFAVIFSALHLFFLFSVLPYLIVAVGLPVNYVQALLAQAVFLFVLYFVPTPGASGVAEGGGAAIFGLLVPWNMAGVMAVSWRFFTEYLAIGMGAIIALRMIGWGLAEDILNGKTGRKDERIGE